MPNTSNTKKSNKKTDHEYDSVLLAHLISPLRFSNLSYLIKEGTIKSSGPKETKKIRNRLDYLKNIQSNKPEEFLELCDFHQLDPSSVIDINQTTTILPKKLSFSKKKTPSPTMKLSTPKEFRDEHDHCVNVDQPELNKKGMLWFRDNKVGCNGKSMDILTIYKPLFDPRDYYHTSLSLSPDSKSSLILQEPIVPTYLMEPKNISAIHAMEVPVTKVGSIDHGHKHADSVKRVAQSHSVLANKLNKEKKSSISSIQEKTNYKLQFALVTSEGDFGNDVVGNKLHPNLRTIPLSIPELGKQLDVYYIYWKVVIDGELASIDPEVEKTEPSNPFLEAQKRLAFIDNNAGFNPNPFDSNDDQFDVAPMEEDEEDEDEEEEEEEEAASPAVVKSATNDVLAFLELSATGNSDDFSTVSGGSINTSYCNEDEEQKALATVIAEGRAFFKEGTQLIQEMDAEENPYKKRPRDQDPNDCDDSSKKHAGGDEKLAFIEPLPDDGDDEWTQN